MRQWIIAELERLGASIEVQTFTDTTLGRPLELHNLIGRFGPAGGRSKRIGIVAVARKLAIALWRYVEHGVIPEGATLKA